LYFDERRYNEAMAGDDMSFCDIGMDFARGNEYDYAVDCWKNIEHKDIAAVYNNLGVSYFYGNGVEQNFEKALEYYKRSEALGNDFGVYNVGVCYEQGVGGVKKDLEKAIQKYRIAAKMGNNMAVQVLNRLTHEHNLSNYYYDDTDKQNQDGIWGGSRYEIERGTNYAYKLKKCGFSFEDIYRLSVDFINKLEAQEKDELFEMMSRGVDILDSEPLLNMYIYSYGKMHSAKLNYAFKKLPQEFICKDETCLIDYGCGQGIGMICYHDFLREIGCKQKVKKIILIDPSEFCLKRAGLHARHFFPEADLYCICKTFNNLTSSDLFVGDNMPSLNIFSNVLDMDSFDINSFTETIKNVPICEKYFLCVSPYINKDISYRLDSFANLLDAVDLYKYTASAGSFILGKKWTCDIRIFKTECLENIYNSIIEKAHIAEAKCRKEIGTIMGEIFLKETVDYYLQALNVYQNPDAYYNLANLYKDFEKYDEAIKYYQKSLDIVEDNEVYCNMGVCYYNKYDDIKAIECFEKAIELNKDDYISFFNMGNALHNLGRDEEAEECYIMSETIRDNLDMYEPPF